MDNKIAFLRTIAFATPSQRLTKSISNLVRHTFQFSKILQVRAYFIDGFDFSLELLQETAL